VLGFDHGRKPYRQAGQPGTVTAQGTTNNASTRDGISGFFARMFSVSSYTARPSTSSGYAQPSAPLAGDAGAVVLCQPVEGVACHPVEGIACQPVEGIACQPVTMVPVPMIGTQS
jgi:hypothetical protein